jgi:membrane carboxypeptidase/penicillin-binding protein PbpC
MALDEALAAGSATDRRHDLPVWLDKAVDTRASVSTTHGKSILELVQDLPEVRDILLDAEAGLGRGQGRPLAIRLGAGAPPFRWLVDGTPLPVDPFARQAEWRPDGTGFVDLAVIDATGRAARASVFLQ